MIVLENHSLKNFNTFGIDVTARYFAEVQTVDQLQTLLKHHASPLILGGGSNVLLTKNSDRLVIHNGIKGIDKLDENHDHVFLKIGAGENWHAFVLYCLEHDYAGVENLSLIPGTLGATPIQNIGAYGVEIKDVLVSVDAIDMQGNHLTFSNEDCQFGYRDSIFKHTLKDKVVITHVTLKLNKNPVFHVDYGAIRDKLKDQPLSIQAISNAIIQIRQEKLPDPKHIGNAGSFFKNPVISAEKFSVLQQKHPKMPYFLERNGDVKIPAGWLIEQCGFKGKRIGNTGIHEHQALVLVNFGNATGAEIKALSENIQSTVQEAFDISLTTEVNIY
jgi:UDP-N-acetylmuramate dehydrogenase